jgi:(1->4)-alpha-D-glucan 1-alpha-D-glucosylmutase
VRGVAREHVCVFARTHGKDAAITIAPRLVCTLMRGLEAAPLGEEAWSDTEIQLPPSLSGRLWRNVLTRETLDASKEIRVSEVLRSFSVALITSSAA